MTPLGERGEEETFSQFLCDSFGWLSLSHTCLTLITISLSLTLSLSLSLSFSLSPSPSNTHACRHAHTPHIVRPTPRQQLTDKDFKRRGVDREKEKIEE